MNLKINFLGHTFKNPVIPASGTFGFGYEFSDLYDINILGSISCKGTTLEPRYGNPLPRIAECSNGLINSIGLQNPGSDKVKNEELVKLSKVYNDKVIINVGGHSVFEYVETVRRFNDSDKVFLSGIYKELKNNNYLFKIGSFFIEIYESCNLKTFLTYDTYPQNGNIIENL